MKLALRLFSVIANSAGCERVFSGFGIIHVPHRNKLKYQKVHNTALVKLDILQQEHDAGVGQRKKRRYGDPDGPEPTAATNATTAESDTPSDPAMTPFLHQDPTDFAQQAQQLISDAQISNEVEDEDVPPVAPPPPPPAPAPTTSRTRSSHQQKIPLATLFDYTIRSEKGVGFYWEGARQNLDADELVHDILHAALGSEVPST